MTAVAVAELSRVQVTLAGLVILDHIIEADRAAWFAAAMGQRYRSCQVHWEPHVAEGNELIEAVSGDRS